MSRCQSSNPQSLPVASADLVSCCFMMFDVLFAATYPSASHAQGMNQGCQLQCHVQMRWIQGQICAESDANRAGFVLVVSCDFQNFPYPFPSPTASDEDFVGVKDV